MAEEKITIDCTPTDDGFMNMGNLMLETIMKECISEDNRNRVDNLLNGLLEVYRYLYAKGYRYEHWHIEKKC